MDAFLSDIFDVRGVDHAPFIDPASGALSHAALMRDARLVLNASFRFAWHHLSGGALPSARCFAEFRLLKPEMADPDLGAIAGWILTSIEGPFYITQGTRLMRERLKTLEDGRFEAHVSRLKDPASCALHQAVVEKLIDRHMVLVGRDTLQHEVRRHIQRPLYAVHRDLTSVSRGPFDEMRNLASGMIASHEEELADKGLAAACRAPLLVGRGDAIKRRFSRDVHFLRRQFGKPYVTAPSPLMGHAEVVRVAVGAPWAVDEACAREVEQHSPVIAGASVRLHTYERGGLGLRAPPPVAPPPVAGAVVPSSMLILFGAGADVSDAELASYGDGLGYQRIFRAHVQVGVQAQDCASVRTRCRVDRRKLVYPLFFGVGGVQHWSYGILASSLRKHLASPCPMQSLDRMHAHLLVDRCVTSVAISKGVLGADFSVRCSPPEAAKHVVLAIDTRMDPSATIMSIMIALKNLSHPEHWAVRVMCSRRNRFEFERMLHPMCPCATFDQDSPELNVPEEAFDVESSYNALMKSPATWRALLPADVVLTVQDDGLLMRRGVEQLMTDVVYLGAPWADQAFNAPIKAVVPTLVGNGGLSLRNISAMISMAEGVSQDDQRRLFHTRSQPIPEDVMYASLAAAQPRPPFHPDSSRLLSCEQVPHAAALGFHKPWPYWAVTDTFAHMEMLLSEV